ncbi:MAG: DNA-binding protein WhiA [Clostridiales bacterium]|nr:DNA-binding protein WhiA [Clostridiales bacterium]
MSFTDEVKGELIHAGCERECCFRSEAAAAALLSGGLTFRGMGRYGLAINVGSLAVSRYYFALIKRFTGITPVVRTEASGRQGGRTGAQLAFPEEAAASQLSELKLLDENALFGIARSIHPEIIKNECCRAAFLKSAFLVTGQASDPEKEYAVSLTTAGEEMARAMQDICTQLGLKAGVSRRRQRYVVYIKEAESVGDFFALTGAAGARLRLENARIMRDIKNRANRLTNCDSGNIARSAASAARQTEDIQLLLNTLGRERLPDWALEIASIRLENPEASLSEMGEMCDPPLAKSGVNKRLKRISEMADEIRRGS